MAPYDENLVLLKPQPLSTTTTTLNSIGTPIIESPSSIRTLENNSSTINPSPGSSSSTSTFPCNYCSRVFSSKSVVRFHQREHTQEVLRELISRKLVVIKLIDIGTRIKKYCPVCAKDTTLDKFHSHLKSEHPGVQLETEYSTSKNRDYQNTLPNNNKVKKENKNVHNKANVFSYKGSSNGGVNFITTNNRLGSNITSRRKKKHQSKRNWALKHTCKTCNRIFFSKKRLRLHLNSHRYQSPSSPEMPELTRMDECSTDFQEMETHINNIPLEEEISKASSSTGFGDNQDTCQVCGEGVMSADLRVHVATHLQFDQLECSLCDFEAGSQRDVVDHILLVHYGREEIEQSEVDEEEEEDLDSSRSSSDQTKSVRPFKCNYCDKSFHKQRQCKIHESSHRRLERQTLAGNGFGKRLPEPLYSKPKRKKNNTSSGVEISSDVIRSCKTCGDEMPLPELLIHIKTHITKDQRQCELCKHVYANVESLREHMHTHYGVEPHRCILCNKTYSLKQSVLNHIIRNHKAAKPLEYYSCTIPQFTKTLRDTPVVSKKRKEDLTPNEKTSSPNPGTFSSGIKPQQLKFHVTSSPQPPPPVCEAKKTPMKQVNFQCNFCQRVFTTKFSVQRHEAKLHDHQETDPKRTYKTTFAAAEDSSDTFCTESQSSEVSEDPQLCQWGYGFSDTFTDYSYSYSNGEICPTEYTIPFKKEDSLRSEITSLLLQQDFMSPELSFKEIPTNLY